MSWIKRLNRSAPVSEVSVSGSRQSYLLGRAAIAWLSVLVSALVLLTVYYMAQRTALDQLRNTSEYHMTRLSGAIEATLGKHEYLPALLAQNELLRNFLNGSSDLSAEQVSVRLQSMNQIARTLDIYVMNADGVTLASSNWDKSHSFVGKNYAFRPYFEDALNASRGRYFALGTNSQERGYYFSALVKSDEGQRLGVVVAKMSVGQLEAEWQNDAVDFMVTDKDGIIFMASRSDWRLSKKDTPEKKIISLRPLSQESRRKLQAERRYSTRTPEALNEFDLQPLDAGLNRARINGEGYLSLKKEQSYGWDVYVFAKWDHVTHSVELAVGLAALLMSLTGLLILLLWKNQQQRRRYEQQVLEGLETKVEERTYELRRTQEELVQAAKMAALGQLSAAITHEINNPLSAIRTYADNAQQFLQIGRSEMAEANLQEITGLTERMAMITRQLKTFSRKSQGRVERCDLAGALDSALLIMQSKLTQHDVALHQQRNIDAQWVQADLVWLEQILVNLYSNAIDAVSEQPDGQIWLSTERRGGEVFVYVSDNGGGISVEDSARVFEAFFTTKSMGKGLGLGLSISYRLAQDMGGELTVGNSEHGGAVFSLKLAVAKQVADVTLDAGDESK
uniref:C4-dicarboxylate transport sensor protein DctB n=1 Tax=uncultured Thiotrichaceae bacterium TaxID=298394 RepID=A0A6S6U8X8_9GAMM|nr:MAG: Two-component system, NtrC family, C4-dicarboxylate transport sensor histidine kinase DctB [uncultured Thiotrichaceae bacterium]